MTMNPKLRNGSGKKVRILVDLLALLVTVIFAMSYINFALAAGNLQKGQSDSSVRGEVVAVDNFHHNLRMLTLRSENIGKFPNDSLNIFISPGTTVKICSESEPSKDLNVSRNATVTYHEVRGWLPVADTIREQC